LKKESDHLKDYDEVKSRGFEKSPPKQPE